MQINIIAAVSDNGVIGKNGALPWHIPEDLKRFKELTLEHTVVMGRKTFESLGCNPLSKRFNCVITKNRLERKRINKNLCVYQSIRDFFDDSAAENNEIVWIIGGENIYREFMPHAQKLYITRVHQTIENGTAFFPEIDLNVWHLEHVEKNDGFDFEVYSK